MVVHLIFIVLIVRPAFGQQLFFKLVREDTAINDGVSSIAMETSQSQTTCFTTCLHQEQCCYVQVKQLYDKWVCALYSFFINLDDSEEEPSSNIFSVVDQKEKCSRRNCLEWFHLGFQSDGIYNIVLSGKVTKVFCDMTNEGGGWTVFQRRINGAVNFQRTWDEYKNGFGDINGDYWLSNDVIHQLTNGTTNTLIRIKATSFQGVTKYIIFQGFWIEDEVNKYKLHAGNLQVDLENLGSSWLGSNGQPFSTKDEDNDIYHLNCATACGGGWWYKKCYGVNPNNYYSETEDVTFCKGMTWGAWNGHEKAMKYFSMSLK